jgi:hypothetical protein
MYVVTRMVHRTAEGSDTRPMTNVALGVKASSETNDSSYRVQAKPRAESHEKTSSILASKETGVG